MYQKEIVYMNLFENNIKNSCVGYIKLEKKQENYSVELQVKNVPNRFTGNFPIRFQCENDWKEPDTLPIKGGCGKWAGSISEPITRAEVILTDAYKIKGESKKLQLSGSVVNTYEETINYAQTDNQIQTSNHVQAVPKSTHSDNNIQAIGEEKQPNNHMQVSKESTQPDNHVQASKESARPNNHMQASKEVTYFDNNEHDADNQGKTTSSIVKAEKVHEQQNPPQYENTPLYESKWDQLLATYEQIHPYGDNRVYVKLEPKDFIILRSNYQHLVNNSFLLHGFYNYRYLILGKEKDFYIGVPGVFYEREKMVALMFGFEAFECEGGNAEEGKFGYYLRKVEI